jgi:hypothetical protein
MVQSSSNSILERIHETIALTGSVIPNRHVREFAIPLL